ncbi:MAG: M20/M25/M40 family metallo-hydrolase [Marinilabiliales bacterium]|nr:M20/M25/M40 family metallo-hydrolase [Marinilabiliales bacterium]
MKYLLTAACIAAISLNACKVQYQPKVTEKEILQNIKILSSDQFQGRKPGLPGDSLAAHYVLGKFKQAGLTLLYNNGFQPVKLVTGFTFGTNNQLECNHVNFELSKDFEPLFFSANKRFTGKVAFVGYGLTLNSDSLKWDDYQGIDASGRWVLLSEGLPSHLQQNTTAKKNIDLRTKVLTAIDHHAAGILVVSTDFSTKGAAKTAIYDKSSAAYAVPVIKISKSAANQILGTDSSLELADKEIQTKQAPFGKLIGTEVIGEASVLPKITKTQNVVGLIKGKDPKLQDEFVVVGAHYDHLGYGGPGSGSRMPDSAAVHHGADDNASGVAAVIELAQKFSHAGKNRRSIVFVAFTAEEFGLIGSKAFVAEPPFNLKKTSAMFNFDMVGRLDTAKDLTIGGVGTSLETKTMVDSLVTGFNVKISKEGYGPSDHASFYGENIPVIYFTSGVHDQYHTPKDTYDRINLTGEKQIIESAAKLVDAVANRSLKLTYQESGPKVGASGRTDLKVTLGIIPDFSGTGSDGMRIDGVTPGKPASKAGLQKGDIIVAIDGKSVGSIYDYMARMKAYSPGQIISVDVLRNGEKKVFLVTL